MIVLYFFLGAMTVNSMFLIMVYGDGNKFLSPLKLEICIRGAAIGLVLGILLQTLTYFKGL